MKRNKGFTLIELLAVIVVLTVIALITIPTIMGVIEKTRKNSLLDSAYGLIESANLYAAQYGMNSVSRFDIENGVQTSTNKLSYKGKVENGTVLINTSGEVTVCVNSKNYSAYKNYKDNKVTLVDNKNCTWNELSNQVYLDGDKTITEYTNQELTELVTSLHETINNLQNEINELKNSKPDTTDIDDINTLIVENNNNQAIINNNLQSEITILKDNSYGKTEIDNLINNINNKHDTDITNINSIITKNNNNLKNSVDVLNTNLNSLIKVITLDLGDVTFTANTMIDIAFDFGTKMDGYDAVYIVPIIPYFAGNEPVQFTYTGLYNVGHYRSSTFKASTNKSIIARMFLRAICVKNNSYVIN